MRTARSLTVSCHILCTPPATTHTPCNHACPPAIMHAPPQPCTHPHNHACHACPPQTTHVPPVERITYACKNITFPQLRLRTVNIGTSHSNNIIVFTRYKFDWHPCNLPLYSVYQYFSTLTHKSLLYGCKSKYMWKTVWWQMTPIHNLLASLFSKFLSACRTWQSTVT